MEAETQKPQEETLQTPPAKNGIKPETVERLQAILRGHGEFSTDRGKGSN